MSGTYGALEFARLWRGIGWLMLAVVVFLTLTPNPPKLGITLLSWDKAQHTLAYAFLAWWFLQAGFSATTATIVTGLILLGVALEFAQGAMGVRFMEVTDMVANALGVVIGWVLTRTPVGEVLSRLDAHMVKALDHVKR